MPFFSVVIPLYNKENFIESTLNSVLQQSFIDFEVILVNDGSTDNSEAKIKQYSDSRIRYFYKENEGASSARNFGIEKANADYISFLDADDYWYPDFLQELFTMIKTFPDQRVFAAAIEVENPKNVIPSSYSIEKTSDIVIVNYFEASYKEGVICTSCCGFHKSVFENVGTFDPVLKSGQDTDMWIRIGLFYPVVFSFKILARYVYDPKSLSKKNEYLNDKLNFSKFEEAEKGNAALKKFLDLNRYSLALKAKLNNDIVSFDNYQQAIDLKSLILRKKILLFLPGFVLRFLLKFNMVLVQLRLSTSVFK